MNRLRIRVPNMGDDRLRYGHRHLGPKETPAHNRHFDIDGDATADELEALVELSIVRSAVYDVISNDVPEDVEVSASQPAGSGLAANKHQEETP